MALPLPYFIDDEAVQGNFDEIKKLFPLSRKNMKVEVATVIGVGDAPAFQNSWVNYNSATHQVARFWKDPMGIVHIEGLIKDGTGNLPCFTLPAGYRPVKDLIWATDTNAGAGRVDVTASGLVVPDLTGNVYFSLSPISFRQEQ